MIIHEPEQPVTHTGAHFNLLQETGFKILQEDGFTILTDGVSPVRTIHAREVRQILHAAYESSVVSI